MVLTQLVMPGLMSPQIARAAGTTYYVSPGGNDSNEGSQSSPFRTIGKALQVMQPGDTTLVRGGTYSTASDRGITSVRSGTSSAYITIKAYPGETPVFEGNRTTTNLFNIKHSYIEINGLTAQRFNSKFVHATAGSHARIINNTLKYFYTTNDTTLMGAGTYQQDAIFASGHSDMLVDGLKAYYMGGYATVKFDSPNSTIKNSLIQYWSQEAAINAVGTSNIMIDGVVFKNANEPSYINTHVDAIQVWGGVNGLTVRNSRAEHSVNGNYYNAMLMAEKSSNIWFYNNVARYSGPATSSAYVGPDIKTSNNVYVFNNTVYGKKAYGIRTYSNTGDRIVYNNVVIGSSLSTDATSKGNNFTSGDPQFVNPSAGNFNLQSTSPLIDKGNNTPPKIKLPATDIEGKARIINGTADIGAHEYGSVSAEPTPEPQPIPEPTPEPAPGDNNTAPSVSFATPANGATVSGSVYMKANASDNGSIAKVEFYLDGTLHRTEYFDPYEDGFDSSKYADGQHTIEAKAYDNEGNMATAKITVTIKNNGSESAPTPASEYNPSTKYDEEKYEPNNLDVKGVTDDSITLRWDKPASGSPAYYKVYISDKTGNGSESYLTTVPASQTTYTHSGLDRYTRKWYKLTAVYTDGESTFSDTAMGQTRTVRYQENRTDRVKAAGSWIRVNEDDAAGLYFFQSRKVGSYLDIEFVGTNFALLNFGGPGGGIAKIYIDGKPVTDGNALGGAGVDMYSSKWMRQNVIYEKAGLPYAEHTVRIEVTGQKNPSSSSTNVTFDAIDFYTE